MTLGKQNLWGIVTKALSLVLGFVMVAVLARILSPVEYGIYSVALATLTILAVPTALGLPNYVVREVAGALAEGQPGRAKRIVRAGIGLVAVVSAVVLGAVGLWAALTGDGVTYKTALLVGMWLVPLMALIQVLAASLRGVGRVSAGLTLGLVLRHLLFLGVLLVWVLLADGLDATRAMELHVFAALLALGFGVISWLAARPKGQPPGTTAGAEAAPISVRTMLMSTGVMGIIAGAQTLNANLDVIMIGALRDAETAGIYKLASTAALLTVAGLQAINLVMMPHFARAHREQDTARLQRLATRSAKLILVTAAPVAVLLVIAGRQIIALAFGDAYADSYTPMIILVAGQVISALFGSVVSILNMTGHEVDTMKGVLLASVVNIGLNALLIPPFGAAGAAWATAITIIFWNTLLHVVVRRRLSINSTAFRLPTRSV